MASAGRPQVSIRIRKPGRVGSSSGVATSNMGARGNNQSSISVDTSKNFKDKIFFKGGENCNTLNYSLVVL